MENNLVYKFFQMIFRYTNIGIQVIFAVFKPRKLKNKEVTSVYFHILWQITLMLDFHHCDKILRKQQKGRVRQRQTDGE